MSAIDNGILKVLLREAWIELPAAHGEMVDVVEGLSIESDGSAQRLRGALETAINIVRDLPDGSRSSHALVLQPESGQVDALLSMRVSRVTSNAYENYLVAARSFSGSETIDVLNRTVGETVIPTGRAILSQDFTLPITAEGIPDPAMERAFLALFPEGGETAIEFTLMTQNLALFADASAYLMSLASGENPLLPGMRADDE